MICGHENQTIFTVIEETNQWMNKMSIGTEINYLAATPSNTFNNPLKVISLCWSGQRFLRDSCGCDCLLVAKWSGKAESISSSNIKLYIKCNLVHYVSGGKCDRKVRNKKKRIKVKN